MRPKHINMDLDDVDANGVFADQTLGGAGDFTLNGAGVTGGEWVSPDGFAKQIGFESTGNISGVTFTVTGFQDTHRNIPLTEALAGPNNATVETSGYFAVITSISAGAAVGTNTEAGPVDEAVSDIIPTNWRSPELSVDVRVTGTIDYSLQQTFDDLATPSSINFIDCDDTDLVGATASQRTSYTGVPTAIRMKVNSYSSGAALEIGIVQRDA